MVATAIDKLVDNFPHPNLPPIVGQPTYETLAQLHLKLNSNAASIHSNLGNGQLGLLQLTLSANVYNTLSAIPFISPTNPGESVTIPRNSSDSEITELNCSHDKATALFRQYDAADKALKQQIVGAVEDMFLRPLRSKYVGYQNSSTLDFFNHLYATYANINASDLLSNDEQMKADYDANQPIELFFDQIEDAVDFAAAGDCPYTPTQVTAIAYQLVFKTGLFHDECKLWKRRIAADKNWAEFKTVFSLAHQELRESQLTSSNTDFHSANAATDLQLETAEAIANLATATAADRTSVASLTATISKLTAELSEANAKLYRLAERNGQRNNSNSNSSNHTDSRPRTAGPHYCHTHGSQVWHKGPQCRTKGRNHKNEATEENKMGGSTKTFSE
mgnify:FL=1